MKKISILSLICALAAFGVCLSSCDLDAYSGETPHQHTYSSEWSYDDDYHWHEADCEHKDEGYVEDLEKHTFSEEPIYVEIEAGCGSYGVFYKECLVCGYVKAFESEPTGLHNFGAYQSNEDIHWIECLDCGYVLSSPHNLVLDQNQSYSATCGEDGLEVYVCLTCGFKTETILEATGNHTYGEYHVAGDKHYQECLVCGNRVYEDHLLYLDSSLSLDPTCGTPGHDTYACFYCDYTSETYTSPTGNHIAGDDIISNESGHYNICSVCGQEMNFEKHSFEYHYNGLYSEGTHYEICRVCGYQTEEVSHNFESEIITEATCGQDGTIVYTCIECGYSYEEEIPATGVHLYDQREYTVEPTCTSSGYGYLICSICGHRVSASFPALGHNYESGVYSYNDEGHYQVCTRCNEPTETISHTINEEITLEPDCTNTGLKNISCLICDYAVNNVEIAANGHDYDLTEAIYTPPTCTEDGLITAVCKVCGAQAYNEVIPATGHTYGDFIQDGDYHYQVCSVCHESSTPELHNASEDLSIDVDGHNIVCKDCGATMSHTYHTYEDDICTVCGYELPFTYTINSDETVTINGLKKVANDVTFASCINGYPVTAIGNSKKPIDNGSDLKTIYVPSSVIEIEYEAFYKFSNLESVCLSEGLTTLGDYAFASDKALADINLPETLETIGSHAFDSCSSLTEITIPSNVSSIGKSCFYTCSVLKNVTINSDKLTEIPTMCFYDCENLASINFPDGIVKLNSGAFEECYDLHEVVLPKSVEYIACSAFGMLLKNNKKSGLTKIYYLGTPEDKALMTVESKDDNGNSYSIYVNTAYNATWYYYDEDGSIYGNDSSNTYWHYVEGVPTLW